MPATATKVEPVDPLRPTEVNRVDLSEYLRRAMLRLGVQAKELEYHWRVSKAYVSRVLSNQDPLADYRVAQLPVELQAAMHEEWAKDLGVIVGRKAALIGALESLAMLVRDERLPSPAGKSVKADLT